MYSNQYKVSPPPSASPPGMRPLSLQDKIFEQSYAPHVFDSLSLSGFPLPVPSLRNCNISERRKTSRIQPMTSTSRLRERTSPSSSVGRERSASEISPPGTTASVVSTPRSRSGSLTPRDGDSRRTRRESSASSRSSWLNPGISCVCKFRCSFVLCNCCEQSKNLLLSTIIRVDSEWTGLRFWKQGLRPS